MSSLLGCDGLWGDGVEVLGVGFNGQKWKFFHRMLRKAQGLSKKNCRVHSMHFMILLLKNKSVTGHKKGTVVTS